MQLVEVAECLLLEPEVCARETHVRYRVQRL